MKKLSKEAFEEIKGWIYRNARPLDLAFWRYQFESGDKNEILNILKCYQNEDGGLGKTIDPDSWNPNSTPYNVQTVIKILRQIDFVDITHPLYQGIFRFLENTEHKSDRGWFFTVPSNDLYPRGVWWNYGEEYNFTQNIGTTASLCGFILRYVEKTSGLYQLAFNYTQMLIERLKTETEHGDMGVYGYCEMIEDIEAAGLSKELEFDFLTEKVAVLVQEKIIKEKDNFMANPLEFVTSPQSKYYNENKDEVEKALDNIVESRPIGNVWGIPWEWYNEYTASKNFAISENWWKAAKATEKLMQLRTFGRLE